MYRLLIKVNNVWIDADMSDDAPAMTYQANDLAELKDRQADYSQAVKLPVTPINIRIFGYANEPSVISDTGAPYKRLECRIFANERLLAGYSSYIVLLSVNDFFNCQILSGNANFFDALSDINMADVGGYHFIQSIRDIKDNSNDLYKWMAYNSITDEYKTYGIFLNLDPAFTFPFINVFEAAKILAGVVGFTISHNLTTEQIYKPFTSISTYLADSATLEDVSGSVRNTRVFVDGDDEFNFDYISEPKGANGFLSSAVVGSLLISAMEYTAPNPCSIVHTVRLKDMANVRIQITKLASDGTLSETLLNTNRYVTDEIDIVNNVTLEADEKVRVILTHIKQEDLTETFNADYSILVNVVSMEQATKSKYADPALGYGVRVPIFKNMGFDTALDFFKMFMQIFGFIAVIDPVNKVVNLVTYKAYYDNKVNAIDWTNKVPSNINGVNTNEQELTFDLGSYGQVNTISFQEKDDFQDIASFRVYNEALAKTKSLFEIKLESGFDKPRLFEELTGFSYPYNLAYIPNFTYNRSEGTSSINTVKPHLVYYETYVRVVIQGDSSILGDNIPAAQHLTVSYMVNTFYDYLSNNVLKYAKVINVRLHLTDEDIENFNPLTPVYLKQYGNYYIVNKIQNYISGKLTKTELIKL